MVSRRGAALVAALVLAVTAAACGPSKPSSSGGAITIDVAAASSLTEAFTAIRTDFERAHPKIKVVLDFGASSSLVEQVRGGSPADVLATADTRTMDQASAAHLVDRPTTFARNRLQILVRAGNPKGIRSLADLDRRGVSFVLCAPEVPCGAFGRKVLDRAGVHADPVSLEPDVKAAVARVTTGEVDAAVVYATDVEAAGSKGTGVAIADRDNAVATYPIATVRGSGQADAARQFVDYVRSPAGRRALTDAGFLPP